ncbi:MAG: cytochrome b [Shimia sp.]
MPATRYSHALRVVHWLSALIVFAMLAGGFAYWLDLAGDNVLRGHHIGGQVLILLIAVRLFVRARSPKPARPDHATWERTLASIVQTSLYAALITFVITGYVAASAMRDNVLLVPLPLHWARSDIGEQLISVHYTMKWILLALLALHIAGALKHALIDRDRTLARMWFGQKGNAS